MSAQNQIIFIQPMLFIGESNRKERIESKGHLCPDCHGSGWHWGEDERGERVKEPCRICEGRGKLDAVVTIEWKPAQ